MDIQENKPIAAEYHVYVGILCKLWDLNLIKCWIFLNCTFNCETMTVVTLMSVYDSYISHHLLLLIVQMEVYGSSTPLGILCYFQAHKTLRCQWQRFLALVG